MVPTSRSQTTTQRMLSHTFLTIMAILAVVAIVGHNMNAIPWRPATVLKQLLDRSLGYAEELRIGLSLSDATHTVL